MTRRSSPESGSAELSIISVENQERMLVNDGKKSLEQLIRPFKEEAGVNNSIKCVVRVGSKPSIAIIQQVLENNHDILFVSTRDKTFADSMLGNTTMEIMRRCPCPIWAVKPRLEGRDREKIMVGIHFDNKVADKNEALNKALLTLALRFEEEPTKELHLVNVVKKMTADIKQQHILKLATLMEPISKATDMKIVSHVLEGDVTTLLPEYVKEHEIMLVVLGMLSRTGLKGFFIGNTAEKILKHLNCSVLTVKPTDFVSPVKIK